MYVDIDIKHAGCDLAVLQDRLLNTRLGGPLTRESAIRIFKAFTENDIKGSDYYHKDGTAGGVMYECYEDRLRVIVAYETNFFGNAVKFVNGRLGTLKRIIKESGGEKVEYDTSYIYADNNEPTGRMFAKLNFFEIFIGKIEGEAKISAFAKIVLETLVMIGVVILFRQSGIAWIYTVITLPLLLALPAGLDWFVNRNKLFLTSRGE